MEVDDLSHVGAWMRLLAKQKDNLQAASKRKGERPKDRKSRAQLMSQFMSLYTKTRMRSETSNYHLHQSFVPPPYQPSVARFEELERLLLKDLQLETHHRGSYVLLRAVTPANVMTAVMAVMEDENDAGVMLQVYQQKDDDYRKAEDVFQRGAVCIVKEPYFKIMNDGEYGLRIDHVSDIIWLPPDDDRVPRAWRPRVRELKSAEALKNEGDNLLKEGKLYQAAELYTQALQSSASEEASRIFKLNRSLANLRLGYYDQVLEDAGILTAAHPKLEKGLYRGARALYELGRFQECHDTLVSLLADYPHCTEAEGELLRTKIRLREQEQGDYDLKTMHKTAQATPPCLDFATYMGPVTMRLSPGRGRGLFTTRDVVAGDLLLCEKAFSYCWADTLEGKATSKVRLLINTHTNRMVMGTQADLITDIVQKLYRNPSLMPAFTSLHHGDYQPVGISSVDEIPVVDTFLVDRIISLNAFGCPRTSFESHFQTKEQEEKDASYHTSGLFINASYINHSCNSNARRSFIGDMQIVRAARNMPTGTEITFWYHAPDHTLTYEKTQEKFQNWGFKCTCAICEQKKATKKNVSKKREELLKDLLEAFGKCGNPDLPKAERLLAALEKTYSVPASNAPRLALRGPYLHLMRLYSSQDQPGKVIKTSFKYLQSLGCVISRQDPSSVNSAFDVEQWGLMDNHVIEAWIHVWIGYAQIAPDLCKKAEEYARTAYKICIGEDVTFDEKYGKVAHQAMFEGLDLSKAFQNMKI